MVAARSDASEQSVPSLEIAHTLVPVRDAMLTTRTRVQGLGESASGHSRLTCGL